MEDEEVKKELLVKEEAMKKNTLCSLKALVRVPNKTLDVISGGFPQTVSRSKFNLGNWKTFIWRLSCIKRNKTRGKDFRS